MAKISILIGVLSSNLQLSCVSVNGFQCTTRTKLINIDKTMDFNTMEENLNIDEVTLEAMSSIEQGGHWRKRGPYGRLRNIITYICWIPQRRDEFAILTRE